MSEFNDFGFSTGDSSTRSTEATATLQQRNSELEAALTESERRLRLIVNHFDNFLTKLCADPDKDYIKWPNRTQSIDDFKTMIHRIKNSGEEPNVTNRKANQKQHNQANRSPV